MTSLNEEFVKKAIKDFIETQDYFTDEVEFGEEPSFGQITRTQLTPVLSFYFLSIYVTGSRLVENETFGILEPEYDLILILINEAHVSNEDDEEYELADDAHKRLGDAIINSLSNQDNLYYTEDETTYRYVFNTKNFEKVNEIIPTTWDESMLHAQLKSEISFTLKGC